MTNILDVTTDTTHDVLRERLRAAAAGVASGAGPRDVQQMTDTFMASTCRHLCAVNTVLVPAARQWLPDGTELGRDFGRHCRRLEVSLRRAKGKVYGEAHAIHLSWGSVWEGVRTEFDAATRTERQIVRALVTTLDVRATDALANRLYRTEVRAPTRPHPYAPRHGLSGRLSRRAWAQADRLWDSLEGRVLPQPVSPRVRGPHGLVAQYLLGNPRLGVESAADVA
ncbi:MAG TPA: hypothetical protein VFZ64_15135 [Nocardioidaceae bacterium]